MRPALYTIGYEGRSIEEFMSAIAHVGVLYDVRHNAISRRSEFNRAALENYCADEDIAYEHLPDLGIASAERRAVNLRDKAQRKRLFRQYKKRLLKSDSDIHFFIDEYLSDHYAAPVALMCYEADPTMCHRSVLAKVLRDMGHTVEHLIRVK